jgi:ribosomal protein S13
MKKLFNNKNLIPSNMHFSEKRISINWAKIPINRFMDASLKHTLRRSVDVQAQSSLRRFIKEMKKKSRSNNFNQHFSTIVFQELKLYRSFRQSSGFPSNGQRTKTNAKTSKQMLHYIQLLQKYINNPAI